jgi:hypothetical protein
VPGLRHTGRSSMARLSIRPNGPVPDRAARLGNYRVTIYKLFFGRYKHQYNDMYMYNFGSIFKLFIYTTY